MISLPDTASLLPQVHPLANGAVLYALPSASTELVKLDLLHEAGSAYQPQILCAAAANRLFTVASNEMDANQMAEFLDYRGIIVEQSPDTLMCTTSFYFLRRYFDELLPVIQQLLEHPAFPQDDFDVFLRKRKQELQVMRQKSSEAARRLFYQSLFGFEHPLGRYAVPDDADRLSRDIVMRFFFDHYKRMDMVASGNIDDRLLNSLASLVSNTESTPSVIDGLSGMANLSSGSVEEHIPGAVQTTLRVGRILPLAWDSLDYARFMILTTLLGGYFGSRLMSNLREDKGYTYGIQARTQVYRGVIVFYITSDVAASTAEMAEKEIRFELQRLCDQLVDDDELQVVKTVLAGDFIRSVDGIFERSERLCSMLATGVTESFTDNLRQALLSTTAEDLHQLALRLLQPDAMLYCRAGALS